MKKVYSFLLCFALLLQLFSMIAFAEEATETYYDFDTSVYDKVVYDFDYDSGVLIISTYSESTGRMDRAAGYVYVSGTYNKYFYLISNGEKLAEYSLTANFRYDTDANIAECRSTTASGKSVKNGWSISYSSTPDADNSTSALAAGRGDYTLYEGSKINNTDTIIIYCDHKGKITKT